MGLGQVVAAAVVMITTTLAIIMIMTMLASSNSPARAPPLLTACMHRREVDTWLHHGPGDVVRVTVLRQPFEDAEYATPFPHCIFVTLCACTMTRPLRSCRLRTCCLQPTPPSRRTVRPNCLPPLHDASEPNRRAVQFIPSSALLHRGSRAPDAGQLPTHVERKDLGHLTNEYLFQGTRGLWFSLRLGVAPLHNMLCAGPLSVYARLYQAGDAVALASTPRPFYQPHLVLKRARRYRQSCRR